MRVTVDRGILSALLICHAVARVCRKPITAAWRATDVRRGCRCGRDERSASSPRGRASHFATVRTPAASAARRCVQPRRRTRVMSNRR
jgi:hypothetical protein